MFRNQRPIEVVRERALQGVAFDRLTALMQALPGARGEVALLTGDGKVVQAQSAELRRRLAAALAGGHWRDWHGLRRCDDGQGPLLRLPLQPPWDEPLGEIAFAIAGTDCGAERLPGLLRALADQVLLEVQLRQEADQLADELAERYEELNLVYDTEQELRQFSEWKEALQHLLNNAVTFLDVGMAALVLTDERTRFQCLNPRRPPPEPARLLGELRRPLVQWMQAHRRPVVCNAMPCGREGPPLALPGKLMAAPVLNPHGGLIGVLVMMNRLDGSDFYNSDRDLLGVMARMAAKIILANHDDLTGLLNRQGIEYYLEHALDQAQAEHSTHCVLNVGIDKLRVINDTASYAAGDALIKRIAGLLSEVVRDSDPVARLGGDEFLALLHDCPREQGEAVAERLLQRVRALDFTWEGARFDVSVSIGMAVVDHRTPSVMSVLSSAEIACEAAQESGRNRVKVFTPDSQDLLQREDQMQWVSRIQAALREDRFVLYAQEIAPVAPGRPMHYEILLRLRDEQDAILGPYAFMPTAERYHMMPAIDRWVITHTLALLQAQRERVGRCEVVWGINLSGQSLTDDTFLDFIVDSFAPTGIPPQHICFEITETTAIGNLDQAREFVARLRERGFRFALDDFGTGLSSFNYLLNLDVDYLKIDGTFVRQVLEDRVSQAMVAAAINVGHAMELGVIAEFVETAAMQARLAEMGVDYVQGYGIGKPRPLDEVLPRLAAGRAAAAPA